MSPPPIVSLDVLRTLHRIHRQLRDLRERLDRGPIQIRAVDASIAHREGELAKVHDEVKTFRKTVDQKQLQLRTNEQKIKDLRTKLNGAATNREYQILKEQIAADEMANSVLEDEIIEVLEQIDKTQPKIAECEAFLATAKANAAKIRGEVGRHEPLIRGDIERLETELRKSEEEIPSPVREIYLRIARTKGEDALAAVIDGSCGGCNQQIPLNLQAEVRMSHPTFCRSCGRLLYLPENADPVRVHDA